MSDAALQLYWFMIALVAVPSAPFNRVAAVIVAARIVNQAMWTVVPEWEPTAQAFVFGIAGIAAVYNWRTAPCLAAAVLFLPMAVASGAWAAGVIHPADGWSVILGCGILQLLIVPFGNDWPAIREGVDAVRDLSWINRLLKVPAWTS